MPAPLDGFLYMWVTLWDGIVYRGLSCLPAGQCGGPARQCLSGWRLEVCWVDYYILDFDF